MAETMITMRMRMIVRLLLVIWVSVLIPTLCPAGILSHACPEDASNTCGHETDCAGDPCSVLSDQGSRTTPRTEFAPMPPIVVQTLPLLLQPDLATSSADERDLARPPRLSAFSAGRSPLRN